MRFIKVVSRFPYILCQLIENQHEVQDEPLVVVLPLLVVAACVTASAIPVGAVVPAEEINVCAAKLKPPELEATAATPPGVAVAAATSMIAAATNGLEAIDAKVPMVCPTGTPEILATT
jgi:hypothetical protein